jgi:integrase
MRMTERRTSQIAQKRFHLTASEMYEILDLARKESARDWCVLVLALNHCCRVSELAGGAPQAKDRAAVPPLRLVDVEPNHITVRRLKGSLTTRQPLINHRGKPTLSDKPAIELFFTGQKGRLTRFALKPNFLF